MKRPTAPLDVLIVEDEFLLAMDLEEMIEDSGHTIVGQAASLHDVEALDPQLQPDLAFVDIQLARNTSGIDAARHILKQWPDAFVVFVTANPGKIPEDFAGGHGVIPKPFTRNGLLDAMHYIEQGVCEPPPVSPQPSSFMASPAFAATWKQV